MTMPLSRRSLLSGTAATVLAAKTARAQVVKSGAAPVTPASGGLLSLGLHGPNYYSGFNPFLNWWKVARDPTITRRGGSNLEGKAIWDVGGYLDTTTGEILNPAPGHLVTLSRIFYAGAGSNFSGMRWTVKWEGSAICTIGGLTAGGSQSINNRAGYGSFMMGTNPGNTWAVFTVTNVNDPPRNIRIYQSQYAPNVDAGEKFNPDWLKQIRPFGLLRFMGWQPTNNETITDFSQLADEGYTAWCQPLTASSPNGPKGSAPLSLICELANLTRRNIHVCIPHLATDAFVRSFAEYFRDHVDAGIVVTFEYSNECWNFGFLQTHYCSAQGSSIWPGDGARYSKWYGYRAAQCMKIVRDVFNSRSRWRGCLGTQTVNTAVTSNALIGVNHFRSKELSPANSLSVTDLFDDLAVTGYFGDVQQGRPVTGITRANPAVVTSVAHGYKSGQRLKLFISAGMTQLNDTFVTVANATADAFALSGVDSSGYSSFGPGNNYAISAELFELMDSSKAKSVADPVTYPTKYTYFNQVVAESWLSGTSAGFSTSVSVAALKDKFWPAQKIIADRTGLRLMQYEGGLHYVGDGYLNGYGGNAQFTDYLLAVGHSPKTAAVYAAMYAAFLALGGQYPSKFVEGGLSSRFGTWAGMRFIPGDEDNPVWVATRRANGV